MNKGSVGSEIFTAEFSELCRGDNQKRDEGKRLTSEIKLTSRKFQANDAISIANTMG